MVNVRRNQADSFANCQAEGGYTLTIYNAEENAAIRTAANNAGLGSFWLGIHDRFTENTWVSDGTNCRFPSM